MNGYSLAIDISSAEETAKTSTPIKTLRENMVGRLNLKDSSIEVFRGSDAELNSTFESETSPKKIRLSPKKKVTFNLPPASNDSESDFYEEPDSPRRPEPFKPSRRVNIPLPEKVTAKGQLNDVNEPPTYSQGKGNTARDYMIDLCSAETDEYFAKLSLEFENEEKEIYMSVGSERGPHQVKNYLSRSPVQIKKEIPHCLGLPAFLATRGARSRS